MKYWKYYLIRDHCGELREFPQLYAIALTKDDKSLFEKYRDMRYFHAITSNEKLIEKEDLLNFNRLRLKISAFRSINEFGLPMKITMQTTCSEEENVVLYHDKLNDKLINMNLPNPHIFLKKYAKDLKEIGYTESYLFSKELDYQTSIDLSKESTRIDVDEFKVFMKLYGYTMKG